jgi:molybdenum cofactor guanylyltransferase
VEVETTARFSSSRVTAAVLAGGESTRFGSDKALARLPGDTATFLERVVSVARSVADKVVIVAPDRSAYRSLGALIVLDLFPGEGPAGGVLTALREARTEWLLVLSCDQPLIETRDLATLLDGKGMAPVLVFQSASARLHPLPCLIRVDACRSTVEAAYEEGCRSLTKLHVRCGVKSISIPDREAERRMSDIDSPADMPRGSQSQPGPA